MATAAHPGAPWLAARHHDEQASDDQATDDHQTASQKDRGPRVGECRPNPASLFREHQAGPNKETIHESVPPSSATVWRLETPPSPRYGPTTVAASIVSQAANSAGEPALGGLKTTQKARSSREKAMEQRFCGRKPYFWVAFSFPERLIGLAFGTWCRAPVRGGELPHTIFGFWRYGDGEEVG